MSSGREGVSEVHTKQFDLINLVDAWQICWGQKMSAFWSAKYYFNCLVFVDSKFVMSGPVFKMAKFQ